MRMALERHLRKSWRSNALTTVQNFIGSMPERLKAVIRNKETLFQTNIEPIHCLEVTLSSCYCAIFGCCNIIEHYNCCRAAICIISSSNNFITARAMLARY